MKEYWAALAKTIKVREPKHIRERKLMGVKRNVKKLKL